MGIAGYRSFNVAPKSAIPVANKLTKSIERSFKNGYQADSPA